MTADYAWMARHTCPKCEGEPITPGILADGTEVPRVCDLCEGRHWVGHEEWLDYCADQFADPMPRGFHR